jgi:hypothetical protein
MNIRALAGLAVIAATVAGCGGDGGSSTEPEQNRAPDLQGISNVDILAGETETQTLVATDPDEDMLTFVVVSDPGFLTVRDPTWNGAVTTATLVIAPAGNVEGTFNGTVRVSDPDGLSDDAGFTIQVTRPNQAPSLSSMPEVSVTAGETENVSVSATDPDGDPLSFTVSNNPGFVSIQNESQSGNTTTATMVVAPGEGMEGTYDVAIQVSDGRGGTAERSCHIEVAAPVEAQTQLFLDWVNSEDILSNQQRASGNVRLTMYGSAEHEWTAVLSDPLDGDDFGFVLWLGAGTGAGQTGVFDVSIRIRHNGVVNEVASTTFSVPFNTNFVRFDAEVTGTSDAGVAGDDVILYMSVSGVSQSAVLYGADIDSHILVPGEVSVSSGLQAVAAAKGDGEVRLQGDLTYWR